VGYKLQMLADNPTRYYREPECTGFISKIPVTWDETIVPAAKVGHYIVVARKKLNEWFVGAMTSWDEREITLNFSFLDAGKIYKTEIFRDGINADRNANDYEKVTKTITKNDTISIKLAPGGGWTARIYQD
jgi:alpha-glucosidase